MPTCRVELERLQTSTMQTSHSVSLMSRTNRRTRFSVSASVIVATLTPFSELLTYY